MPSNYTPNYNLNQWARADKVLMDDFNADNAKIDAAIQAVDAKAGSKADASALEAEIAARTSALATVNTALSRCGNCRVQTYTYEGTGVYDNTQAITRSFPFSAKPAFFLISGSHTVVFGGGPGAPVNCVYSVDGRSGNGTLAASWSGYTVTLTGDMRCMPNSPNNRYQMVVFYAVDAK